MCRNCGTSLQLTDELVGSYGTIPGDGRHGVDQKC